MKTIGIEAFLSWAYREELPKALATSADIGPACSSMWGAIGGWADSLGALVSDGRPNSYGVMATSFTVSAPHDDAIAAHAAVIGLDSWDLDMPDDWDPLTDLGLGEHERLDAVTRALPRILVDVGGQMRHRQRPGELVRHHAIMRNTPVWQAEVPKARFVSAYGKPLWFRMITETIRGIDYQREVDGFNPKSRRPYPGAYRKTVLDPDPALAAADRAEYEVWHAALGMLVEVLNAPGYLKAHRLVGPAAPARPWEVGASAAIPA